MKHSQPLLVGNPREKSRPRIRSLAALLAAGLVALPLYYLGSSDVYNVESPEDANILAKCASISTPAGPPASYDPTHRIAKGSDRHVVGTPTIFIQNARIWTGAANGTEILFGDILLDKGLVVAIGTVPSGLLAKVKGENHGLQMVDAGGKWVTPGLVDFHSHIGVNSAPYLEGARDTNSHKAPILPWLRSIDGLNTHDDAYELSMAGGVTTAQILPGSANNIGGQAFVIKLRPTAEKSVISKVLEPPQTLVANQTSDHLHWRHMKHACGENPRRVYSQTRMDGVWNFREAYDTARKIKNAQDTFCAHVQQVQAKRTSWMSRLSPEGLSIKGKFPENLQWESLVDVLRGRVKLAIHCYEAVDLDGIIRLSNEFKFPIASFHHAMETYLVPEALKETWGGAPSIAMFATNARKKREMYRHSEFAPKILAEHGIPVIMKSDHPVLNSRYLISEAQLAHYYGLDAGLALASVTSTPAKAAGIGHRVGTIAEGYDADIAIWDSHPLALGTTPVQVYIDGIPQLNNPHHLSKPKRLQEAPRTPNWDVEANQTVLHEGLPPLRGHKVNLGEGIKGVRFVNMRSIWIRDEDGHVHALFDQDEGEKGVGRLEKRELVLLGDGSFAICPENVPFGPCAGEMEEIVDLQGGSLAPGLTTFGSPLGLVEIRMERSTNDGVVIDPLMGKVPKIVGGDEAVIRAVDGLQFEGRNTLLAYRGGVTRAITAPLSKGFLAGLSTTIDTGAANAVEKGAIIQAETALHVAVSLDFDASVSTQIATLRRLLEGSTVDAWVNVRKGEIPLVVNVESADVIATLLTVKSEYEAASGNKIRLTFVGASEAHLLAREIGKSGVSVVLTSPRSFPGSWEKRRILPGPPLTQHNALSVLLANNVTVAIGTVDEFSARNTRFEIAQALLDSDGTLSRRQAIALATTNLENALGSVFRQDLVAYRGGTLFDLESKIAGVVSLTRGTYERF